MSGPSDSVSLVSALSRQNKYIKEYKLYIAHWIMLIWVKVYLITILTVSNLYTAFHYDSMLCVSIALKFLTFLETYKLRINQQFRTFVQSLSVY